MPVISPSACGIAARDPRRRQPRILAQGLPGASIAEIAQAAGVSDGLVYKYFDEQARSTDHRADSVLRARSSPTRAQVDRGKTFARRLRLLMQTHLGVFVETRACAACSSPRCASQRLSRLGDPELNRRYTPILIRIVDDGIRRRGAARHGSARGSRPAVRRGGAYGLAARHRQRKLSIVERLASRSPI